MGVELGRISGPLLAANLVRHGIDLAFENDLLYFDVNNGHIGIKTDAPGRLLDINGTTHTLNLIADTQATIADLKFVNNRIQNDAGSIVISPNQLLDPTVVTNDLQVGNFDFSNRSITNLVSNSNTTLASNGMGRVLFNTDTVNVFGDLHATGNITFDGNIIIGDSNTDSVDFNADLTSNIIPDLLNTYDLGSVSNEWKTLYSHNVNTSSITASTFTINDVNLLLSDSNVWYVSINGSDLYYGNHERSTFRTLKKALSVAQSGDTVVIFPGTYEEEFPLTVPQGVAVNGASLRSTTVIPTEITKSKDAFLLNGESTVENITVKDFFYDSENDTGYAFRFAPNIKVTSRSPYVRNVTVITTEPPPIGAGTPYAIPQTISANATLIYDFSNPNSYAPGGRTVHTFTMLFQSYSSINVMYGQYWFIPAPLGVDVIAGDLISTFSGTSTVVQVDRNVTMSDVYGSTTVVGDRVVIDSSIAGAWGSSLTASVTPTTPSPLVYDLVGNNNATVNGYPAIIGNTGDKYITVNSTTSINIPAAIPWSASGVSFVYYFVTDTALWITGPYYNAHDSSVRGAGWRFDSYNGQMYFAWVSNGSSGFGSTTTQLGGIPYSTGYKLIRGEISATAGSFSSTYRQGGQVGYYQSVMGDIHNNTASSAVTIGQAANGSGNIKMILLYETAKDPGLTTVYDTLKDRFGL